MGEKTALEHLINKTPELLRHLNFWVSDTNGVLGLFIAWEHQLQICLEEWYDYILIDFFFATHDKSNL